MRTVYHQRLTELAGRLGEMCSLAGIAMKRATQALLEADIGAAEQVIRDHERIVAMRAQVEKEAFALLALQHPVAGELREIFSAVQIIADTERMGALAVHIAKITRREYPNQVLPEEVRNCFADMAKVAIALGDSARQVLVNRDPQEAAQLHDRDDANAVPPFSIYQHAQQMPMQVIHRVIFMVTGVLPTEDEISTY